MKRHYTKLFYIPMSLLVGLSQSDISYAGPNEDWPIVNGAGLITESPEAKDEPQRPIDTANTSDMVTTIDGDSITGFKSEELVAIGNAVVARGDQQISADKIVYRPEGKRVHAVGNVILEQPGLILLGEELSYSAEDETGEIDVVQYFLEENDAHGIASTFFIDGKERQRASNATYSTCDIGENDVYLKTSLLTIDRVSDVGYAKHPRIMFKGAPILYSPFITFPLGDNRKTGLLTPSYGQSVTNGFELEVPFYWNIAPNYDGTITTRNMANRGTQLKTEWRYLGANFGGKLDYDYIGDDKLSAETKRNFYHLIHTQNLHDGLSGYLDFQGVSDDDYFTDLSTDLSLTSQVHLPRKLGLTATGGTWTTSFQMVHYQSLNFATTPFQTDPRLYTTVTPEEFYGGEIGGFAEFIRYSHPTLNGATRTILAPYAQLPLENDFLSVNQKVTYHLSHYDVENGSTYSRYIPIYSLDSSVVFERDFSVGDLPMVQTLEPRIFYAYAPYRDQSGIPNFDSGLKGFDFSSIFTDNLFSGNDRVNDANHFTIGLTSRFFESSNGIERLRLSGAQRYFAGGNKVSGDSSNRSDILLGVAGRLTNAWAVDSLLQYSGVLDRVQKHQHSFTFSPEVRKTLRLTHRSERDSQEQFDLSGQWALSGEWSAAGKWNYSRDASRLIEGLAGFEYDAGCWGLRFLASRLLIGEQTTGDGKYSTQYMVQLDLKGFTRIGQDVMGVLKEKVAGYSRQDN
jgi:LPS-assembly protein